MVKQLKRGGNSLKTAYWSLVGMASVALISLQPVMPISHGFSKEHME